LPEAVVIMAKRTPIGKQGGALREVLPEVLGSIVLEAVMKESRLEKDQIDEVIFGNVVGPGGNLARLSLLTAGFPCHVPGVTIDLQCGSGLQAIHFAVSQILSGMRKSVIAGGVESSSRAPWKIEKPVNLYSTQAPHFFTRARFSPDSIGDPDMGIAAENVAQKYGITRHDQDEFALLSHRRAVAARKSGSFDAEVVPVPLSDGSLFMQDEGPRENTSLEKLERLSTVFQENGTVTAGNACGINDGAAAVLLTSSEFAKKKGLKPVLRYIDSELIGVDPNYLGIGPVPAVRNLLTRQGLRIKDIDLIEFNEAFAAQVLACVRELDIKMEQLNVAGGAIALGHPYGASGAVLLTRLFYQLVLRKGRFGIATLGVGGGLGIASLWERVVSDETD
jgi:acetyl-CoA C-acetyltransferase